MELAHCNCPCIMPGRGLSASKGGSRDTERPPSQRTQLTQLERLASRTRSRQRPPAQQLSEARGAPPRTSLRPQKKQSSSEASAALQATPGLASPAPKRGLDPGQIAGAHKPVGLALGSAHILATACQLSGRSPTAPCVPSPGPAPAASPAACMQGHSLGTMLLMPACACPIKTAHTFAGVCSAQALALRPQPWPHAPLAPAQQPARQKLHQGASIRPAVNPRPWVQAWLRLRAGRQQRWG